MKIDQIKQKIDARQSVEQSKASDLKDILKQQSDINSEIKNGQK